MSQCDFRKTLLLIAAAGLCAALISQPIEADDSCSCKGPYCDSRREATEALREEVRSCANPQTRSSVPLCLYAESGDVVLRDKKKELKPSRLLLIPTAEISGIECAILARPGSINYFERAWNQHERIFELLNCNSCVDRTAIGLAVNATGPRHIDQLHIHIDCVQKDVRDRLASEESHIPSDGWWRFKGGKLDGVWAQAVVHDSLAGTNPFARAKDLAQRFKLRSGDYSLAVIGAPFGAGARGFAILVSDHAAAEEWLDPSCAVRSKEPHLDTSAQLSDRQWSAWSAERRVDH